MGSQPALPFAHKDRRSEPYKISRAHLTASPFTPPLVLPHSNVPLHPARPIAPNLLDSHQWLTERHCWVADITEPIPPRPCRRLHRSYTFREQEWPQQNPRDP